MPLVPVVKERVGCGAAACAWCGKPLAPTSIAVFSNAHTRVDSRISFPVGRHTNA